MPALQKLTRMKTHTAMVIWSNHLNAIKRSNGKLASQHIPRFIRASQKWGELDYHLNDLITD